MAPVVTGFDPHGTVHLLTFTALGSGFGGTITDVQLEVDPSVATDPDMAGYAPGGGWLSVFFGVIDPGHLSIDCPAMTAHDEVVLLNPSRVRIVDGSGTYTSTVTVPIYVGNGPSEHPGLGTSYPTKELGRVDGAAGTTDGMVSETFFPVGTDVAGLLATGGDWLDWEVVDASSPAVPTIAGYARWHSGSVGGGALLLPIITSPTNRRVVEGGINYTDPISGINFAAGVTLGLGSAGAITAGSPVNMTALVGLDPTFHTFDLILRGNGTPGYHFSETRLLYLVSETVMGTTGPGFYLFSLDGSGNILALLDKQYAPQIAAFPGQAPTQAIQLDPTTLLFTDNGPNGQVVSCAGDVLTVGAVTDLSAAGDALNLRRLSSSTFELMGWIYRAQGSVSGTTISLGTIDSDPDNSRDDMDTAAPSTGGVVHNGSDASYWCYADRYVFRRQSAGYAIIDPKPGRPLTDAYPAYDINQISGPGPGQGFALGSGNVLFLVGQSVAQPAGVPGIMLPRYVVLGPDGTFVPPSLVLTAPVRAELWIETRRNDAIYTRQWRLDVTSPAFGLGPLDAAMIDAGPVAVGDPISFDVRVQSSGVVLGTFSFDADRAQVMMATAEKNAWPAGSFTGWLGSDDLATIYVPFNPSIYFQGGTSPGGVAGHGPGWCPFLFVLHFIVPKRQLPLRQRQRDDGLISTGRVSVGLNRARSLQSSLRQAVPNTYR